MDDLEKTYLIAVNFLSYRPRTEKEVRSKLLSKDVPLEITDKIIDKLKEQKFINDEEFVRLWISHRSKINPKSLKVIKMELLQKGIPREILEKALAVNHEEIDDFEQAKKLIEKRMSRYKNMSKQEVYQKLGGFLGRRGFNWDTIKKAIDEATKLEYNS